MNPVDFPDRIAVIGSPGAGKSWLSSRLGVALGLPVRHMDKAFWQPGWVKTPHTEYVDTIARWAAEDRWVIDGNYSSTLHVRLPRAQLVIWLDLPVWRCTWGIMRRWWLEDNRDNVPDGCSDEFDLEFLWYTLTFRLTRVPATERRIREWGGRCLRLRTREQVMELLDRARRQHTALWRLPDGREVRLRPLRATDRELYARAIALASPETLRARFHATSFRPTASQLDYLTRVDQVNHIAVGATLVDQMGEEQGIGVARCVRPEGSRTAELAVAVLDGYQRQGLGTRLVREIMDVAREKGVHELVAFVDGERRSLVQRLCRIGFHVEEAEEGVVKLTHRIPGPADS
ncbi:MAG: GNAT family N-acetyltransferase [Rhodothermales bacterium]|nr:GNAT family N-acetyltransferase [Rhodothermales bacterium]MBO6779262.1 GNAT family N-acetyltransferase [Rhodothermales bacterium]